ncbi:MAG: Glu-tRNA(Gln) amidotransferase subunit GatD [Candidatus Nitrosopolaris sp.]
MEDHLKGYKEKSQELPSGEEITVGDTVTIKTSEKETTGILMPRYESADKNHIVIKLKSGYNIGIRTDQIQSITKIGDSFKQLSNEYKINHSIKKNDQSKARPKIALLGTGGTIASKVDYRTGGVTSALSASEIYASVPELANYASVEPEVVLKEYSENLNPSHWTVIANKIKEKVTSGEYQGILVSHGTDTMHYTAAALSFALQNLPIPVVLVGAQRSSDRPSSDAALNLIGAAIFALKSELTGVFVCMHASLSDDLVACHLGTRLRKNHTSKRDAFESIDGMPIALIRGEIVEMQLQQAGLKLKKRDNSTNGFIARPNFDRRVVLLKYYPGFNPELIAYALESDCRAIILEGTGLGHVGKECFPQIRNAVQSGRLVFMTSQCIWGRTRMTVYETGRDLLDIGVISLSDMMAETATVKAMWVLANSKDVKSAAKLMQENIANEISMSIPIS